jgi:hypothetical protein
LHEIEGTARDLRHELLETIPARDLQTCLRVLTNIRNRAASVSTHRTNGKTKMKVHLK